MTGEKMGLIIQECRECLASYEALKTESLTTLHIDLTSTYTCAQPLTENAEFNVMTASDSILIF
jgi:hypothetical protein